MHSLVCEAMGAVFFYYWVIFVSCLRYYHQGSCRNTKQNSISLFVIILTWNISPFKNRLLAIPFSIWGNNLFGYSFLHPRIVCNTDPGRFDCSLGACLLRCLRTHWQGTVTRTCAIAANARAATGAITYTVGGNFDSRVCFVHLFSKFHCVVLLPEWKLFTRYFGIVSSIVDYIPNALFRPSCYLLLY